MVWQKGHEIVLEVYKLFQEFPITETYSLVDQIKRAIHSVSADLVVRYFLLLSKDLSYITKKQYNDILKAN